MTLCHAIIAEFNLEMQTEYNLLQYELCTTLLSDVIKNTMKSGLINHIWSAKQNLVLHGFIHTHSTDPGSIMKVFDICLELQVNF